MVIVTCFILAASGGKARREQQELQKLHHPPEGKSTNFFKRLGERTPNQ